jgi:hypothetical protein
MPLFPTVTVEAAQVGQSPQLLTRLRHREIDGIVVKNVYDRATCEALRIALETGHHDLIKNEFPAKFAAFFYGIDLNVAHPDLKDYSVEAPRFRDGLSSRRSARAATLFSVEGSGWLSSQSARAAMAGSMACRCHQPASSPQRCSSRW